MVAPLSLYHCLFGWRFFRALTLPPLKTWEDRSLARIEESGTRGGSDPTGTTSAVDNPPCTAGVPGTASLQQQSGGRYRHCDSCHRDIKNLVSGPHPGLGMRGRTNNVMKIEEITVARNRSNQLIFMVIRRKTSLEIWPKPYNWHTVTMRCPLYSINWSAFYISTQLLFAEVE